MTELDYDHFEVDRIKNAFLSSYEAVTGPLDRRLLIIYGAHERLEKAWKAVRAVRSDGDLKAERHLERALAQCAELTT